MAGTDELEAMDAIRHQYERSGVRGYYEAEGATYRNPHDAAVCAVVSQCVARWNLDLSNVLDLACGSGEVTLALRGAGCDSIEGVDPFTGRAYLERTGLQARELSFEQIAAGALEGECHSLIVCSYALHLLEKSRLPGVLVQLAMAAPVLLVLTPHKRPDIRPDWGWSLEDEFVAEHVRARLYHANLALREKVP